MNVVFTTVVLKTLILISIILASFSTQAGPAKDQLDAFYKDVKSMQADFVQTVMSESRARVDESRGVLRLQRPGKFRWDYKQPYEQQIVADGEKLWVFDVDMDQVIVKPLDLFLSNTPAVLLSGNADLTQKFNIEELPSELTNDNMNWLKLTPKEDDSGFQQLILAFKENNLQQMQLIDSFGQMTKITFSNLVQNPHFDSSVFQFTPPKGVDVISDF